MKPRIRADKVKKMQALLSECCFISYLLIVAVKKTKDNKKKKQERKRKCFYILVNSGAINFRLLVANHFE